MGGVVSMTKFNPGDPVLVRACVKGYATDSDLPTECECVVLKTEFGNTIIEAEGRLIRAPVDRLATKDVLTDPYCPPDFVEQRVERLARVMCNADGFDPDQRATVFTPHQMATGFILDEVIPAWRLYAKYARALVDAGLV
jgi:hypothetical protein